MRVYGQAALWQGLSTALGAREWKGIVFIGSWRIENPLLRKSLSKPTVSRMPTTLCLAPELSGKPSTELKFNHYITLQSLASCVCHYWLYLVWKTFSCTWQFLEGSAPFGCIWRPVCFKHWEDDNFGSQNKCEKPLLGFFFFLGWFFFFFCHGHRSQLVESLLERSCSKATADPVAEPTAALLSFLPKGFIES